MAKRTSKTPLRIITDPSAPKGRRPSRSHKQSGERASKKKTVIPTVWRAPHPPRQRGFKKGDHQPLAAGQTSLKRELGSRIFIKRHLVLGAVKERLALPPTPALIRTPHLWLLPVRSYAPTQPLKMISSVLIFLSHYLARACCTSSCPAPPLRISNGLTLHAQLPSEHSSCAALLLYCRPRTDLRCVCSCRLSTTQAVLPPPPPLPLERLGRAAAGKMIGLL